MHPVVSKLKLFLRVFGYFVGVRARAAWTGMYTCECVRV